MNLIPKNLILLMVLSFLAVLHFIKMQKALTVNNYLLTNATPQEIIAANNSQLANDDSSKVKMMLLLTPLLMSTLLTLEVKVHPVVMMVRKRIKMTIPWYSKIHLSG